MVTKTEVVIVGQGLAGSCLAWQLEQAGVNVIIIDDGFAWSSSRVAAGLITPVSGRRLTTEDQFEELWKTAEEFYRRIEKRVSVEFFRAGSALRFFQSAEEQHEYDSRASGYGPFIKTRCISPDGYESNGFEMWPAGRLVTSNFSAATKQHFEAIGQFKTALLNISEDIEVRDSGILVKQQAIESELLVFCQGAEGRSGNPWFPKIPDSPVRGEVLELRIEGLKEDRVVHKGIWLAPAPELGNDRYLLGTTYDREHPVPEITVSGRQQLLSELAQIIKTPVEVIEHRAAVRPAMRSRNIVARFHENEHRLAVLNGFGSKGSLYAPTIAARMAEEIRKRLRFPQQPRTVTQAIRITDYVKERIAAILQPGDLAIDATMGNGHDTIFMAKLVGDTGKVLAFDIQESAIDRTALRVREHQLQNVELIHDSHERLEHYLKGSRPKVVVFNLGYLPGSDKSVVTKADSTETALDASVRVLTQGAAIAVTVYRGHEHGSEEFERVYRLCDRYRTEGLRVEIRESDSTVKTSPVLFLIYRE